MSNGWTKGKGRILLNFFIHCPKGTMFIKDICVNCINIVKPLGRSGKTRAHSIE
jgi:hypothetical protein